MTCWTDTRMARMVTSQRPEPWRFLYSKVSPPFGEGAALIWMRPYLFMAFHIGWPTHDCNCGGGPVSGRWQPANTTASTRRDRDTVRRWHGPGQAARRCPGFAAVRNVRLRQGGKGT